MKTYGKYILAAVVGAVLTLSASVAVRCTRNDTPNDNIIRDTLVVHDTIHIEKPVTKLVKTVDTVMVFATDTVRISDTLYIRIPMETKVYADSTYKAQVTGYRASLDWVEVYPQTVVITEQITKQVKKKTHWGIGISAGYGATLNNKQVVLSPYIGVGVSYNIFSW